MHAIKPEAAAEVSFSALLVFQRCRRGVRTSTTHRTRNLQVGAPGRFSSPFIRMAIGLIARKVGMSRAFLEDGQAVPVTYLKVQPNTVVRIKTKEKDGYDAVILGIEPKEWKTNNGKNLTRYKVQKEWRIDESQDLKAGSEINADAVPQDSLVSLVGVSKGKGFQGVMRRHNFRGGKATHGSHFKREPGSVGMRNQPGRIFRGHRMAGRMGNDQQTIKRRQVVSCDPKEGVLAIKGPIPGANGSVVYLTVESLAEKN